MRLGFIGVLGETTDLAVLHLLKRPNTTWLIRLLVLENTIFYLSNSIADEVALYVRLAYPVLRLSWQRARLSRGSQLLLAARHSF